MKDKKIIEFKPPCPAEIALEAERKRVRKILEHSAHYEIERALDTLDKNGIRYQLMNYKRDEKK